ncbi:polymerase [Heartland virus]|uniref:RNA-directed RNA polymerase L n=1 Tax=Heartland virus TaxID=1216928 RepID=A0A075M4H4_HTRV|nr:polymerase [Heartland virus]AIF75093.1 polymerase [Heartland virus]
MNLEALCSRVLSERGLSTGEPGVYDQIFERPGLPNLEVTVDSTGVVVDVGAIPDSASQLGSSINAGVLTIPLSEAYKINHDFTFSGLTKTTDRKLSEVFPLVHDGSDSMTPDVIHTRLDGTVVVIEFTTTRSTNMGGLEAAYRSKLEKYRDPLNRRSDIMPDASIYFGIIVVSASGVLTNMPLTQDEAEELMFRFCVANEIYSQARAMDAEVELQKSEEEYEAISRARAFFTLFDYDDGKLSEAFPNSDIEMLRRFLSQPVDTSFVTTTLKEKEQEAYKRMCEEHYLKSGMSTKERLEANRNDAIDKTRALMERLHNMSSKELHSNKSTVKLPPWVVKPSDRTLDVKTDTGSGELLNHGPYGELWSRCFLEIVLGNVEGVISSPEKELEIAISDDPEADTPKAAKIKYHRFRPELSLESKHEFSLQGIEGKRWKHSARNVLKDEMSHKTMSPFVDVSNIEEFLIMNNLLNDTSFNREGLQETINLLLEKATEMHQNGLSTALNDSFKRNFNTNVVQWSMWVSCLAQELASALKQHCKPGEFIIKKLMHWPIFVIIKPTKSSSHIFYSLAIKKANIKRRLIGDVFTDTIDAGEWEFSEFKSLKTCKLTNLINLPCTMLNSIAFWREKMGVAPWISRKACSELREQVAITFLMSLEDKSTTEELVTLTRYSQMEGFVSPPLLPKPQKMVGKLEVPLRTKLQVFLFRRHLDAIVRVAASPFPIVARDGRVEWTGTFNAITGRSTGLENMVNNWYLGYYKNKEESTELNALGEMYKKIVEIEAEKPASSEYLGWGDTSSPKRHEFSRSFLKSACISLEKEIEMRHGKSWKQSLEERVLKELGSKNLLDLATMKATSNFSKEWEAFSEVRTKEYHRSKLLEKMAELIEHGLMWYVDAAGHAWKAVLDDKCMRICLFKKNQHGGLREIYVTNANARLVQFGVETMARCVCELSPHETIANPRLKSSIIENHGLKSARQLGQGTINVNSSNDAKKWSQGHYTTKLAMVLCWFMPAKFHRFIWAGISMFRCKKMMMDLRFLEKLSTKANQKTDDDFRKDLAGAFHGNVEVPWMTQGATYLQTETGMMQGILHFTSSLLHSCVQSFYKAYFLSRLKEGIAGRTIKAAIDVLEGSDDSAIMISLKPASDNEEAMARFLTANLLYSVRVINPLFGIYSSEKSTANTLFCVEYNSEFHFHKHLVRPTIRWVAASHQISESEALASRQEDYANLLTQCLEGGSSFSLTYLIQCAQLVHHYMLLGLCLHPLFGTFVGMLIEDPDPALGFFIMDNPAFAGGAGFRFNLWRSCKFTNLGKKYAFFFNEIQGKTKGDADYRALDATTGGTLSHSVMIYWGDRRKYQHLLDRMGLPKDWVERIDENPSILYRRPENKQELILRLAEKVHSPGVTSSFSKGHVVPRVVAAGVYLLSRHCFRYTASIHGRGASQKASLIKLLVMSSTSAERNQGRLNPNQERMLFPQVQEYERVLTLLDEVTALTGKFVMRERNIVKSRVELFQEPVDLRCKAENLIAEMWFGLKRTKLGPRLLKEEWDKLRASFSWLSTDHKETLDVGPFLSHVQFRNFIAHVDAKSRSVRLLGAPVKKSGGVTTVSQVVKSNFFPGFILDSSESLDDQERVEGVSILKHILFMTLNGPYTDEQKKAMVLEAFQYFALPHAAEVVKRSRSLTLCLMKNFIEQRGGSILDQIEKAQSGTVGGFSKPQKPYRKQSGGIGYKGKGVWSGIMENTNVQILIDGDGSSNWIEEIRLSSESRLFDVIESVRRLCDDINVNNRVTSSFRGHCMVRLSNFKVKPASRVEGCPVRLMPSSFRIKELQNPDEVFLRVRGDILNLSILLQEDRVMNLLSYRARDTDISESAASYLWMNRTDFSFGKKEPSCSWMCLKTLDSWAWNQAARVLERNIKTPGIDNTAMGNIFKDCLESSLRKQGLLRSRIAEMVERHVIPLTSQELVDILEEDVDFSEMMQSDIMEGDLDIDILMEGSPMLWAAEVEEMGEAMVILSQSGKYYHLKLMDQAATTLSTILGKDGCRLLLGERTCGSNLREQVKPYLTLLQIREGDVNWVSEYKDDTRGLDEDSAEMWG